MHLLLSALGLLVCLAALRLFPGWLRAAPALPFLSNAGLELRALLLAPALLLVVFIAAWLVARLAFGLGMRSAQRVYSHGGHPGWLRFLEQATDVRVLRGSAGAVLLCLLLAVAAAASLLIGHRLLADLLRLVAVGIIALYVALGHDDPLRFSKLPPRALPAEFDAGNPPPLRWVFREWSWAPSTQLRAAAPFSEAALPATTFRVAGDADWRTLPTQAADSIQDPVVAQLGEQFLESMERLALRRSPLAVLLAAIEVVSSAGPGRSDPQEQRADDARLPGLRLVFGERLSTAERAQVISGVLAYVKAAGVGRNERGAPTFQAADAEVALVDDAPGWSLQSTA